VDVFVGCGACLDSVACAHAFEELFSGGGCWQADNAKRQAHMEGGKKSNEG